MFTFMSITGSTEAIAIIEHIMEHIAQVTKQDPIAVRLINLKPEHLAIPKMLDDIKMNSNFENRKMEVEAFNNVISD